METIVTNWQELTVGLLVGGALYYLIRRGMKTGGDEKKQGCEKCKQ